MRFLKRLAGFLGFAKDDGNEERDGGEDDVVGADVNRVETNHHHHHHPRKGFSVPVKVAVERPQLGPILVPCSVGDGGVQGLKWYAKRLKIDEDGDVADEFLDESVPAASANMEDQHQPFPRFEVKYSARQAKVRNQALAPNGKVLQSVEYQGRLQWV